MWTDDALAELQGCLEATDKSIFKEVIDNIHEYADTVSSYIDWCTSMGIPSRTIRVYPNPNPWFNADTGNKIRNRCTAFKSGPPGSTGGPDMSSREPSRLTPRSSGF